ncbi:MAG TPA: T9SS type A sorting domain-containing protein, partial [Segetibacter sp.]
TDVSENTLPANLVNIKAYQKGLVIQVEWTSVTEINVERYEVEKSTDGQTFAKIRTVQASGNSSSQVNYSLADDRAQSGSNYYRIKSIDNNGAVEYSSVVRVNVEKGSGAITIYPNPLVNNTISLQLTNIKKGKYTITLMNKLGQLLYRSRVDLEGGSSTHTLRINSSFPKGIYHLQVSGEDVKIVKRLIKE